MNMSARRIMIYLKILVDLYFLCDIMMINKCRYCGHTLVDDCSQFCDELCQADYYAEYEEWLYKQKKEDDWW